MKVSIYTYSYLICIQEFFWLLIINNERNIISFENVIYRLRVVYSTPGNLRNSARP